MACGGDGGSPAPEALATAAPSAPAGETSTRHSSSRTHEEGDRASFFLKAADQRSDGRTVVVDEAVLTGTSGWIVAHASDRGVPGRVLGVSPILPPGSARGVTITLGGPIVASKAVIHLMIHRETTSNAIFDFPSGDGPASTANGGIVVVAVDLRIE